MSIRRGKLDRPRRRPSKRGTIGPSQSQRTQRHTISRTMDIGMARMMASQKRIPCKTVLKKEDTGIRMSMMTLRIQGNLTSKLSISSKSK